MSYQPDLPAARVDEQLRAAISALDAAEHNAVLWFAEISRRRLYRDLGYSSMRQYALQALGFSASRAADFIRLADRLDELPHVRQSVASGELGYTKAREIIKIASPKTEDDWLVEAAQSSRRELEQKVRKARERAKARSNEPAAAQVELLPAVEPEPDKSTTGRPATGRPTTGRPAAEIPVDDAPTTVTIRLTATQRAQYDALWQRLGRAPNADDLLEALASLADAHVQPTTPTDTTTTTSPDVSPRGDTSRPPVQIHVHQCPDCGAVEAAGRHLDRPDRERLACDAAIAIAGQRNTYTIAPRTRREVLARDRHRCRAPGCDHRRHLEVHHIVARAKGGTNDAANLITLCSACHRLWHERGMPLWFSQAREVSAAAAATPTV